MTERIGVRELRQHASSFLRRVRQGESFEVTDRGRPVARLVPVVDTVWSDLVERGLVIEAAGERALADFEPREPAARSPSLSAVLEDMRRDER